MIDLNIFFVNLIYLSILRDHSLYYYFISCSEYQKGRTLFNSILLVAMDTKKGGLSLIVFY